MQITDKSSSKLSDSLADRAAVLTEKRYSDDASEIAAKVAKLTKVRHVKWLLNRQFVLHQSRG